ncbi:MAG TPA: hypothetical protein PKM25_08235 [Candidatus Ozemobacteraceae bacterium]|nr:hypothetical protein [Candidatus Ozemobacteraceae bacterium]
MRRTLMPTLLVALLAGFLTGPAAAQVKLATLPLRERVEIQLDHPAKTLVEEERVVTLLQGTNFIDFSWANTQIDPQTILFRPLAVASAVRVINVAYPPNENALVWQVYADKAGPVRVRISYLIQNLRRSFSYRATAEADEKTLTLRHFIKVQNFSGEEFGQDVGIWAGYGDHFRREVGLQEAKELLAARFVDVPIQKKFVFSWRSGQPVPEEPKQRYVTMQYVLKNDAEHQMGQFPLQYGKVRIFQKDGHGGEAFTGEDWGLFTPIDDEMKLYLGLARDIKVERTVEQNKRIPEHGNLFHQEVTVKYMIQSFKKDGCQLDIEEDMNALRDEFCGCKDHPAQWKILGETSKTGIVERKSAQQVEIHVPLPPAPTKADQKPKEVIYKFNVTFRNEW